jgi:hypothetical protein
VVQERPVPGSNEQRRLLRLDPRAAAEVAVVAVAALPEEEEEEGVKRPGLA